MDGISTAWGRYNTNAAERAGREMAASRGDHIGAFNAYRDAVAAGRFKPSETAARAFVNGWNAFIGEDMLAG